MCLLNQSQGEGTEVFSWQTAQLILSHNLPRRAGLKTDGQDEPQLSRGGGWNHRATALPEVGTCSSSVACLSPDSPSSSSVLFLFPPPALCLFAVTHVFFLREMMRQTGRIKEEHPDLLAGPVRLWVYISSHSLNQSERSKGKQAREGVMTEINYLSWLARQMPHEYQHWWWW